MNIDQVKKSLLLSSFFLQYPNEDFYEASQEGRDMLETELDRDLRPFYDYITTTNLHDLSEHYVNVFDFGHTVNLYMTDSKNADDRERGNTLLELKKLYHSEGLDLSDNELPDFLPLMLEFAAISPSTVGIDLLLNYIHQLESMAKALESIESPYALILSHIKFVLEAWHESSSQGVVSS